MSICLVYHILSSLVKDNNERYGSPIYCRQFLRVYSKIWTERWNNPNMAFFVDVTGVAVKTGANANKKTHDVVYI